MRIKSLIRGTARWPPAVLLVAALAFPLRRQDAPAPAGIPSWALDEMSRMAGSWVADNSAYQSESEPWEAYGMEWSLSPGDGSLIGRLFAITDGDEGPVFWEFRQFWHPGEQQLLLYQFGVDGTVGIGAQRRTDENASELLQTFYSPDGRRWRTGHRTELRDGERHDHSFEVGEDDVRKEGRYYVWRPAGRVGNGER